MAVQLSTRGASTVAALTALTGGARLPASALRDVPATLLAEAAGIVAALESLSGAARLNASAVEGVTPFDIRALATDFAPTFVLPSGTVGYARDTRILKVGDGSTQWSALLGIAAGAATWAELGGKPDFFDELMVALDAQLDAAGAQPVLLGATAARGKQVYALATQAEATRGAVNAGGTSTATGKTISDGEQTALLTQSGELVAVPWAANVDGSRDIPDHFRCAITGSGVGLVSPALPATATRLVEAVREQTLTMINAGGTDIPAYLDEGVTATSATQLDGNGTLPQVWAEGTAALRNVPAGRSRIFKRLLRRGRVIWTPQPLANYSQFIATRQGSRSSLKSITLPSLSASDAWYVIHVFTWTTTGVVAPVACGTASLPVGDTLTQSLVIDDANPNAARTAGRELNVRYEGVLTKGGTVTFDSDAATTGLRLIYVRQYEQRPSSFGATIGTPGLFWSNANTTTHTWAAITLSGGQLAIPISIGITRANADILHRTDIAYSTGATSGFGRLGISFPKGPVSAWAQATRTGAASSADWASVVVPVLTY